jgi:hypothetical protein
VTLIENGDPGIFSLAILTVIVYVPVDVGLYVILKVPFLLSMMFNCAEDLSGPLILTLSPPITGCTLRQSTVNSFIACIFPSSEARP